MSSKLQPWDESTKTVQVAILRWIYEKPSKLQSWDESTKSFQVAILRWISENVQKYSFWAGPCSLVHLSEENYQSNLISINLPI
jgi:hypothetical protein